MQVSPPTASAAERGPELEEAPGRGHYATAAVARRPAGPAGAPRARSRGARPVPRSLCSPETLLGGRSREVSFCEAADGTAPAPHCAPESARQRRRRAPQSRARCGPRGVLATENGGARVAPVPAGRRRPRPSAETAASTSRPGPAAATTRPRAAGPEPDCASRPRKTPLASAAPTGALPDGSGRRAAQSPRRGASPGAGARPETGRAGPSPALQAPAAQPFPGPRVPSDAGSSRKHERAGLSAPGERGHGVLAEELAARSPKPGERRGDPPRPRRSGRRRPGAGRGRGGPSGGGGAAAVQPPRAKRASARPRAPRPGLRAGLRRAGGSPPPRTLGPLGPLGPVWGRSRRPRPHPARGARRRPAPRGSRAASSEGPRPAPAAPGARPAAPR